VFHPWLFCWFLSGASNLFIKVAEIGQHYQTILLLGGAAPGSHASLPAKQTQASWSVSPIGELLAEGVEPKPSRKNTKRSHTWSKLGGGKDCNAFGISSPGSQSHHELGKGIAPARTPRLTTPILNHQELAGTSQTKSIAAGASRVANSFNTPMATVEARKTVRTR